MSKLSPFTIIFNLFVWKDYLPKWGKVCFWSAFTNLQNTNHLIKLLKMPSLVAWFNLLLSSPFLNEISSHRYIRKKSQSHDTLTSGWSYECRFFPADLIIENKWNATTMSLGRRKGDEGIDFDDDVDVDADTGSNVSNDDDDSLKGLSGDLVSML